ncbi:MAG: hypothetical protein B6I25_04865 [Planctomycetales bacterium 4572_13]|nr:MAG: hypothetical protein B6I25_04865 [Planctomycetales bacterium 4572_13]
MIFFSFNYIQNRLSLLMRQSMPICYDLLQFIINLFIMHGILQGVGIYVFLNFFVFSALCFFIRLQPGPLTI